MQASKLVKSLWKVLPLAAALVVVTVGICVARDSQRAPLDSHSQVKTVSRLPAGQHDLQVLATPGAADPCILTHIYTSLPPKCRTFEGEFIPVPGTSPDVILLPAGK